ncbi:MAG: hypothetical protein BGO87_02400 [Flavobacteriia bacterium 40-80]|nr:MAG: hypothetical protein BGO87_02400 [Flavobacteriia bacterium 40-80]
MLTAASFDVYSQGETLFKNKCSTCHQIFKDGTGPKLYNVREKWASEGAKEGSIYAWVNNWQKAAATDPYAEQVSKIKPTSMNQFPDLTKEDIDAIFNYVDAQQDPATKVAEGPGGSTDVTVEQESGNTWLWIVAGLIFVTIILTLGGVRRQLSQAVAEKEGGNVNDYPSYGAEVRQWMWKNKIYVGITGLVVTLALLIMGIQALGNINVMEAYQPSQPIDFPHSVHAGINGIDCKYCHNSADKSRTAGIPTVNVCMNCHKQISGNTPEQEAKIKKIYEAAGWDGSEYTGKTKPLVWNKVHVLPDHVYFSHQQHVVVGGVDCKQCHGDMTKQQQTARIVPVEELNKIEGNIPLTKPTLTMGWCIECHSEKGITDGPLSDKKSGYYDEIHRRLMNNDRTLYDKYLKDGKVTVRELGGWECAKCHY